MVGLLRWSAFALSVAGCNFTTPGGAGSNAGTPDAAGPHIDGRQLDAQASPDAFVGTCFGTGLLNACFTTLPTQAVDLGATAQIDTNTFACDTTVTGDKLDGVCVIAGATVSLERGVAVTGDKALLVVATQTITLDDMLDASSVVGDSGPGAPANCGPGTAPGSAGGGAGGSFGGSGGDGGNSTGGVHGATVVPTSLVAGCPGQGGSGNPTGGGLGGGAIYFIAGQSITVTDLAAIDASGSGGAGGKATNGGGSGGGAGGMIVFDAPAVTIDGDVWAIGGGGGEGADTASGHDGNESSSPTHVGGGGFNNTVHGGDGGDGTATTGVAGDDPFESTTAGGGGGGGGGGVIQVYGTMTGNGRIAPPAN